MSDLDLPGGGPTASTRPYLIRALHDWCTDNGFTPYLAVYVDRSVQVPVEYVKNNEIVLNVSFDATSGLQLGNEYIEFRARFGGVARDIIVPVDHVIAIYARENGQGMAFPVPTDAPAASGEGVEQQGAEAPGEATTDEAEPAPLKLASTRADKPRSPVGKPSAATSSNLASSKKGEDAADSPSPPTPGAPGGGGRPSLKRIK